MARADELFDEMRRRTYRQTDRIFVWLLAAQWVAAVVVAVVLAPDRAATAAAVGGALDAVAIGLVVVRPGRASSRHAIAAAQMLWPALFVAVTGGRLEAACYAFGSLALLAFYRDGKLLATAAVVACGGYAVVDPTWWRVLEQVGVVGFEAVVLAIGCARQVGEMKLAAAREAAAEATGTRLGRAIRQRTTELRQNADRYRALVERTAAIPFEWDIAGRRMVYVAPQIAPLLGRTPAELTNEVFREMGHPDDAAATRAHVDAFVAGRPVPEFVDHRVLAKDGRNVHIRTFLSSFEDNLLRGIMLDITRQKQLEAELQQAQKLESVGRLAAGVAHEINTPIQFVGDSVQFVREGLAEMLEVIDLHRACTAAVIAGEPAGALGAAADDADRTTDLAYLFEHFPQALDRALDGIDRVARIVRSMKVFAYQDGTEMVETDLNAAIESALIVGRTEYKYVADLELRFGELPPVCCHPGEINQVVLNIVVNAAHAIRDVVGSSGERGRITVATERVGDHAVIRIGDTGGGIPDAIRARVFDPFFTTKAVGDGTGQGLAIARSVVVDKHRGSLTFASQLGAGTTFEIQIPIAAAAPLAAVA